MGGGIEDPHVGSLVLLPVAHKRRFWPFLTSSLDHADRTTTPRKESYQESKIRALQRLVGVAAGRRECARRWPRGRLRMPTPVFADTQGIVGVEADGLLDLLR